MGLWRKDHFTAEIAENAEILKEEALLRDLRGRNCFQSLSGRKRVIYTANARWLLSEMLMIASPNRRAE